MSNKKQKRLRDYASLMCLKGLHFCIMLLVSVTSAFPVCLSVCLHSCLPTFPVCFPCLSDSLPPLHVPSFPVCLLCLPSLSVFPVCLPCLSVCPALRAFAMRKDFVISRLLRYDPRLRRLPAITNTGIGNSLGPKLNRPLETYIIMRLEV